MMIDKRYKKAEDNLKRIEEKIEPFSNKPLKLKNKIEKWEIFVYRYF